MGNPPTSSPTFGETMLDYQRHRAQANLPVREKVRILLELQRQDLPLIERRRPLKPWERPWPITP